MKNASQHRIQSRCRLSYIWERWSDLRSGSRATHAEQTCKLLDLELSTGPLLAQRENELVRKNRSHCVVTTHGSQSAVAFPVWIRWSCRRRVEPLRVASRAPATAQNGEARYSSTESDIQHLIFIVLISQLLSYISFPSNTCKVKIWVHLFY